MFTHLFMFFGMLIIHIFIMPRIMIARPKDYMISLNQIYMGISMASLMVMLEALMHPLSLSGWMFIIILFVLSVVAIRYQLFVDDKQFLSDMIPHHSMALLTAGSIKNKTSNTNIKQLATTIEKTQKLEINIMKKYLAK
jgi:hypothetical protein